MDRNILYKFFKSLLKNIDLCPHNIDKKNHIIFPNQLLKNIFIHIPTYLKKCGSLQHTNGISLLNSL